MTIKKKRNRLFIFKIILLVLLMIAAVGGVVVCGILLAAKGMDWQYVLGLISAVLVGYWSTIRIIDLNSIWVKQMTADIQSGEIASITKWHYDKQTWKEYILWRKGYDKEEAKGMAIWAALLGVVIFFFMLYSEFGWIMLTVVSIGAAISFGILIGGLFHVGYKVRLKKLSSCDTGSIIFTKDAILINELLIFFNQMSNRLSKVNIIKEDDWNLLQFTVEAQVKDRKNEHTYLVPISDDKMEEAVKLVDLYVKVME